MKKSVVCKLDSRTKFPSQNTDLQNNYTNSNLLNSSIYYAFRYAFAVLVQWEGHAHSLYSPKYWEVLVNRIVKLGLAYNHIWSQCGKSGKKSGDSEFPAVTGFNIKTHYQINCIPSNKLSQTITTNNDWWFRVVEWSRLGWVLLHLKKPRNCKSTGDIRKVR